MAYRVVGRNPNTVGLVLMAMAVLIIVLIVVAIVQHTKYKTCESARKGTMLGTNPYGNLNTGGNNPLWQNQAGDAGWGGNMQSTYQDGESRVYGASAEACNPHHVSVVPQLYQGCNASSYPNCGSTSMATSEAQALVSAQAMAPATAATMSDNDLQRVMNGE